MKVVASGDWHLDLVVSGYDCHDDIVEAARVIVDATQGADLFVHLGDLFHTHRPSPRAYAAAIELLDQVCCPFVVIKGNHDEAPGVQADALEPLKHIRFNQDHFFVTYPGCYEIAGAPFAFAPYLNDSKARAVGRSAQQEIDRFFEEMQGGVEAVFCHLDVDGAELGSGAFLRGGVLQMPLGRTKRLPVAVVNGHVHKRQKMEPNLWMPGSITDTYFSREDDARGYAVLEV